jgi:hypothetical protein
MSDSREVQIGGVLVTVSQPYVEGHVCTPAEAKALNQTRTENISNALRKKIQDLGTAAENEEGKTFYQFTDEALAQAAQMVAEYDAEYVFTLASVGGGRRAIDPLEKECIAIARQAISAELKKKGVKLKDLPEGKMDEFIEQYKDNDKIVALAKKRIKERESLASAIDLEA